MYLHLLQYGTNEEQLLCIDLICLCADADRSLAEQALWYYHNVKAMKPNGKLGKLIDNCIRDLTRE